MSNSGTADSLRLPWTAAHQAPLCSPISQSLLKFISIELVMLSNHLTICHPLLLCLQSFPASGSFPMRWLLASGGQSIGASASATILPMNIQGWFPLGLTGLISFQSKGLTTTTIQKHQFFTSQLSLWTNSLVRDCWKNHSFEYTDLWQQGDVSAF